MRVSTSLRRASSCSSRRNENSLCDPDGFCTMKSSLNGIEVKSSTHLSSWMFGAGMLMPNHAEWKKNGLGYSLAYFTECMFVCFRWQTAVQLLQQKRKCGSYLWQVAFLMFCCSVNTSKTAYDSSPEEVFCYVLIVVIFWADLQSTTQRGCISALFRLLFLPSKKLMSNFGCLLCKKNWCAAQQEKGNLLWKWTTAEIFW